MPSSLTLPNYEVRSENTNENISCNYLSLSLFTLFLLWAKDKSTFAKKVLSVYFYTPIIFIFKKVAMRSISVGCGLLSNLILFGMMMLFWLRNAVDKALREEQCGFRKGRGYFD